jgi:prepilin-type N-terminal cleavage/methylation domain-containing protein
MDAYLTSRLVKGKSGFSLVELLVVFAIIATALAIGIPTYNATIKPTAHLNAAARLVYSDTQLARLRAVSENVRCGLAFYTGPDRYIVFIDNNADSQHDGGDQDIKTVNLANDYPGVEYDTAQGGGDGISFANNAFAMAPRALATTGGSVFLTNTKGEGRQMAVTITGSVRIVEY